MPRFVILLHECPPHFERPTHFDLMLERGGSLRTWALDREPVINERVTAVGLPEHRLEYLEYEGPVSGDRGSVSQWDCGTFEWLEDTTDNVRVELLGNRLQGELRMTCDDPAAHRWRVKFVSG